MSHNPEVLSEFDHLQSEIIELTELDEDSFAAASQVFVDRRLDELAAATPAKEAISGMEGNYKGYISPETEIIPEAMGTGFKLDDKEVYTSFMQQLRTFIPMMRERYPDPDKAYRLALYYAAQYAQTEYFSTVGVSDEGLIARRALTRRGALLLDDDEAEVEDQEATSIRDHKMIAACMERASVVNNMLQIAGMQPVMVVGGKLQPGEDAPPELHAYLVTQARNGSETLFDPTNPKLRYHENGEVSMAILLYPANGLLSGEVKSVTVPHETHRFMDGEPNVELKNYSYTNNSLSEEFHPS